MWMFGEGKVIGVDVWEREGDWCGCLGKGRGLVWMFGEGKETGVDVWEKEWD